MLGWKAVFSNYWIVIFLFHMGIKLLPRVFWLIQPFTKLHRSDNDAGVRPVQNHHLAFQICRHGETLSRTKLTFDCIRNFDTYRESGVGSNSIVRKHVK